MYNKGYKTLYKILKECYLYILYKVYLYLKDVDISTSFRHRFFTNVKVFLLIQV